ncbi:hypothetical protein M378DRAFT_171762 [Amanita muscaria Koide BX008]|uniref:Uncharacterized protein n=1 Tax=Amanita muscaria (strain Koide BX008) TaxID=946122 RepID=A0A0C2S425_AMAMK|nr:hypothetical protein M378DRAFT_171762 [Amanita muscaria Koide BX008]
MVLAQRSRLPRHAGRFLKGRLAQDAIRNAYFIICQRPDATRDSTTAKEAEGSDRHVGVGVVISAKDSKCH